MRENRWEFAQGKPYSQNIYQYFGEISAEDVAQKAVNHWYDAIRKYNWSNPEASTFSQLVWKSTSQVGFGVASSQPSKSIVVANYWPKGNIYHVGSTSDRDKYFKANVLPEYP